MMDSEKTASTARAAAANSLRTILVVDADARTLDLVRDAADPAAQVRYASSVDAARAEMLRDPADLVLVNLQIGDHAGLDLIQSFKRRYPNADILALSRSHRAESCLDAFRAGAADLLLAPFAPRDIVAALAAGAARRREAVRRRHRHLRLRDICRRLNTARHDISRQVDLLCNDLVHAYQDMAQQLNVTQNAAEFAQTLNGEIDVEGVLRRTMEWILRKLGPVNAAIYLPNGDDQFALGAYLNLDTQADAPLIEVIGQTIVKQARGATALVLDDEKVIHELFGEEGDALCGRQWLAVGCNTPRECLGVLVVFRGQAGAIEGATELTVQSRRFLEAAAPILADRIEHALGLYQRLHPYEEEAED
jgi:DNA-binding response OmpR family regulator